MACRVGFSFRARLALRSARDLGRGTRAWANATRSILTGGKSTIAVGDRFVQGGRWLGSGFLRLVVFGSEAPFEAPMRGVDVVAPNARVAIATAANNTRVRQLVGREVEIHPDVTLTCDRLSLL